jgi:hypothetical protein
VMLQGGFADSTRTRLQEAYEDGRLEELYAELAVDDDAVASDVREGRLVSDERLREFLPWCADPTSGAAVEPPPRPAEDVEAELADLAFEGMRALTRQQQHLIRQCDRLGRRLRRKDRQLAWRRHGPLWRVRRALVVLARRPGNKLRKRRSRRSLSRTARERP